MWLARLLACLHTLWHCLAVVGLSCPALLPRGGWSTVLGFIAQVSCLAKLYYTPFESEFWETFWTTSDYLDRSKPCPALFCSELGGGPLSGAVLGFMTQVSCLFWRHRICQISYIRKIKTRWNPDGNSLNLLHWNLNPSVVVIQLSCDNSIYMFFLCP